jgi:hypothetical protein
MFTSVIDSVTGNLTVETALLCTFASIGLGIVIALFYMAQGKKDYTKNYIITLILMPALVQVIIMLVNGNLGTGIAILGAFSLIRYRSLPGGSREICGIFFAMITGVATGMGYLTYAAMFVVIIGVVMLILGRLHIAEPINTQRALKITIPENLDYTEVFDDIFETYTTKSNLERVKTTNMGSMYELRYEIVLKDIKQEKQFIDEIRTRNGNLTIVCGLPATNKEKL